MTFADYLSVLLIALAGSGHCLGMCGVFSIAVAAKARSPGAVIVRHAAYQFGKATAYVFIGAVLLLAVSLIGGAQGHDAGSLSAPRNLTHAQAILGYVAGSVMILAGLAYALEVRLPVVLARWWQGSAACGAVQTLWQSPSLFKSVLIGWLNGFLPCGLSLTALLYLASFGSVTGLIAGAYLFGLGTLPALLIAALAGQRIGLKARRWMVRVSGVLLVIFGVLTLMRGNPQLDCGHCSAVGEHAER